MGRGQQNRPRPRAVRFASRRLLVADSYSEDLPTVRRRHDSIRALCDSWRLGGRHRAFVLSSDRRVGAQSRRDLRKAQHGGRTFIGLSWPSPGLRLLQPCRWERSPCAPKTAISSTGPSIAPNQCGVFVLNSTASPGSTIRSCWPRIRRMRPSRTYIQS